MLRLTIILLSILTYTSFQTPLLPNLHASKALLTTSGISSGAFMAVQLHVSNSQQVKGAGVVAGGPYHCAYDLATTAVTSCMTLPSTISVELLQQAANTFALTNLIDDTSNLQNSKVFIFAGTKDSVVNPGVGKKAEQFYRHFNADIKTEYSIQAQHSMVTKNYGNACDFKGSPYINNCNYNLAYQIMNHLYGGKLKQGDQFNQDNLKQFDQSKYDSYHSFDSKGFIYIPTNCQKQSSECEIHVAFHGCEQDYKTIQEQYVRYSGYNQIAQANDIIILYPQVGKSYILPTNPKGCWDWFGYNFTPVTPEYDIKSGPQLRAIMEMVHDLQKIDEEEV